MTETIGNRDTALMLHRYFGKDESKRAPKGFRRIGSGCYRTAYLERATNTVYKIGDYSANVHESAMSRRLRRRSTRNLGFDLYIPRTRTYRVPSVPYRGRHYPECVSAQEFAEGARFTACDAQDSWMDDVPDCSCKAPLCYAVVLERIIEFSGLEDIHYANVLVDSSEVFWLIDMGC